jgi:hypothetical protein
MPKQGHYASARKQVRIKNGGGKVKRQDRLIDQDQLEDFLLVRYALTIRRQIKVDQRESCQRFLQELAGRLSGGTISMESLLNQLLVDMLAQLPWQFLMQVGINWDLLGRFLGRELPAIPLADRLLVVNMPTITQFNELVSTKLAHQIAALTLLNKPTGPEQATQLAHGLQATILKDNRVDWSKVRALMAPLGYTMPSNLDPGTTQWLLDLVKV